MVDNDVIYNEEAEIDIQIIKRLDKNKDVARILRFSSYINYVLFYYAVEVRNITDIRRRLL